MGGARRSPTAAAATTPRRIAAVGRRTRSPPTTVGGTDASTTCDRGSGPVSTAHTRPGGRTARRTGRPQGRDSAAAEIVVDMSIDVAEPGRRHADPAAAAGPRVLDVVVPVYNEETDLEPLGAAAARATSPSTSPTRSGSPSPTTPAPTPPRRSPTGWPPSSPDVTRRSGSSEKGRGRALRDGLGGLGRAGARLLRRRPVHRPRRAAAPLVAPLISGHSDLAIGTRLGPRLAGGPRGRSGSSSRAAYNLLLRGTLAARFSDAQCGFKAIRADVAAAAAAAGRGHRLVLRHRAAGAGRARRAAHPRGAGGLGRRPATAASTSSATAVADLQGHRARSAARWPPGALPLAELRAPARPRPAGHRRRRACRTAMPRQLVRFAAIGVRQHAGLPAAVPAAARRAGRVRRPTSSRCSSPRWPTPRPTAGSPSACAAATGAARHQLQGLLVFGLGLALTTGALAAARAPRARREPGRRAGRARRRQRAATVLRFVALPRLGLPRAPRHLVGPITPEIPA